MTVYVVAGAVVAVALLVLVALMVDWPSDRAASYPRGSYPARHLRGEI